MSVSDKESFFSSDEEEVSSYKRNKSRESDQGPSNASEHEREKETETGEDISQEEKEPTVNIIPMHHLEETLENMLNKKLGKILSKGKSSSSKSKRNREDSTDDDEEREKRKNKKKKIVEISSESDDSLSSLPSEASDSDDIFIINEDDEVGKAIKKSSTKFLHKRFKNSIKRDSFQKILKKYKTPSNATFLKAKKTNKEVWSKLKHYSKTNDNFLTIIQRNLAKAAIAITKASESKRSQSKELIEDGLTILGQTHKQVTSLRRTMQKGVLPFHIKKACGEINDDEDDDLLFGKELTSKIKEAKENCAEYKRTFLEKNRRPFTSQKVNQNYRNKKYNNNNNNNNNNNKNFNKYKYPNRK